MCKLTKVARWLLASGLLLGIGGCFTSQQLIDFGRTEVARAISDLVGRLFQLFGQAGT
jgi:hypothetical protein